MNRYTAMPMKAIVNNSSTGKYTPKFFELADFNLSRVLFNSHFFEEADVEKEIVSGDFSFSYLRESKLRTVDAFVGEGKIPFEKFLSQMAISIKSKNLFKTGKYLSRVFRPAKFGKFFSGLDVHVNNNPALQGKVTDGISLISLSLAKELGWKNAEHLKSAQLTLFNSQGLIKGHCVVSDKLAHDVIVYGEENIKSEIQFINGLAYVAVEPVKLSTSLRMDIQSLLNLWEIFGAQQVFNWARTGIERFKRDLISGRLSEQLDDFDEITSEEYEQEQWLLKKAIYHKLDYTRFPGLMRLAWQMYRNGIHKYATRGGFAAFRIPVSSGLRAYLRVDLRVHDSDGNFDVANISQSKCTVDALGNLWVPAHQIGEIARVLGGGDQDDNISLCPLENGQALLYRNPNQRGEYVITDVVYDGIEVTEVNKLVGTIPQKPKEADTKKEISAPINNSLIANYLKSLTDTDEVISYTRANLLRTYSKIAQNSANIGVVANAEMIRSAIGITKPAVAKKLTKLYPWNLERVIDSVVKDGVSCGEDLFAVDSLINHVIDNGIEIPKCLRSRLSEKRRERVFVSKSHPVDQLLEAVTFIVNAADREILGSGSVSRGNRIPGLIDRVDIPIIEIAQSNFDNPMFHKAVSLLKNYNRQMAILLDSTKDLEMDERELKRKKGIENIQHELLISLTDYNKEERSLIVKSWAYEIYKGDKAVHDSILWISGDGELRGTGEDTIEMLADVGIAYQVKRNGSVKRLCEKSESIPGVFSIRVWSKEELTQEMFAAVATIEVVGSEVIAGSIKINLGDEISLDNGIYAIRRISPSYSRKNNSQLKNSISLILNR
ncbi:hypothetical protein C4588_05040 [Candidatus Parcubacteria bacterium]|jgi:hypothetical protein|nr:MAG: hypothetical protein C4588_05040 [Candidatus Parcubacteria bacterium]